MCFSIEDDAVYTLDTHALVCVFLGDYNTTYDALVAAYGTGITLMYVA